MRHFVIPIVAMSVLALAACERKENKTVVPNTPVVVAPTPAAVVVPQGDKDFANKAAESGLAEVEASRAITEKTASEDIRQLAQTMITDHTAANQELTQIAQSKQIQLPTAPSAAHQDALTRLKGAMGTESDRLYVQEFGVQAHQEAVSLFDAEARDGSDPELKAFAAKTLPTLKTHLEHSQRAADALPK